MQDQETLPIRFAGRKNRTKRRRWCRHAFSQVTQTVALLPSKHAQGRSNVSHIASRITGEGLQLLGKHWEKICCIGANLKRLGCGSHSVGFSGKCCRCSTRARAFVVGGLTALGVSCGITASGTTGLGSGLRSFLLGLLCSHSLGENSSRRPRCCGPPQHGVYETARINQFLKREIRGGNGKGRRKKKPWVGFLSLRRT